MERKRLDLICPSTFTYPSFMSARTDAAEFSFAVDASSSVQTGVTGALVIIYVYRM